MVGLGAVLLIGLIVSTVYYFWSKQRAGSMTLWRVSVEGTPPEPVLMSARGRKERNVHPQWSADGSTIYFHQFQPTASYHQISVNGGESVELVQGWEWGTHNGARVDPEGKRIIYSKMDRGIVNCGSRIYLSHSLGRNDRCEEK